MPPLERVHAIDSAQVAGSNEVMQLTRSMRSPYSRPTKYQAVSETTQPSVTAAAQ